MINNQPTQEPMTTPTPDGAASPARKEVTLSTGVRVRVTKPKEQLMGYSMRDLYRVTDPIGTRAVNLWSALVLCRTFADVDLVRSLTASPASLDTEVEGALRCLEGYIGTAALDANNPHHQDARDAFATLRRALEGRATQEPPKVVAWCVYDDDFKLIAAFSNSREELEGTQPPPGMRIRPLTFADTPDAQEGT